MNIKRIFRDAGLTLIVQGITALSGLFVMFFISRVFGQSGYGDYYLVKRISDVLWLFFLFGMTVSIPRNKAFIDLTDKKGSVGFTFVFFPLLVSLLFLVVSDSLIHLLVNDYFIRQAIKVLVFGMIFYSVTISYLRAYSRFVLLNILTLLNFSIIPILPLITEKDIHSYLLVYADSIFWTNLVIYLTLSVRLYKKGDLFQDIKKKILGMIDLLRYGVMRLPGLFLGSLIFTLPVTLLNMYGTKEQVGALGQIFQMFSLMSMPINALGIILLPNFSQVLAKGDNQSLQRFLSKGLKLIFWASLIISLFLAVYVEEVLSLINGQLVMLNDSLLVNMLMLMLVPLSVYNFLRNPIDAASSFPYTTLLIIFSYLISLFFGVLSIWINVDRVNSILFVTITNMLSLGVMSLFYVKKTLFQKGE